MSIKAHRFDTGWMLELDKIRIGQIVLCPDYAGGKVAVCAVERDGYAEWTVVWYARGVGGAIDWGRPYLFLYDGTLRAYLGDLPGKPWWYRADARDTANVKAAIATQRREHGIGLPVLS